jgi:hypothetical protein
MRKACIIMVMLVFFFAPHVLADPYPGTYSLNDGFMVLVANENNFFGLGDEVISYSADPPGQWSLEDAIRTVYEEVSTGNYDEDEGLYYDIRYSVREGGIFKINGEVWGEDEEVYEVSVRSETIYKVYRDDAGKPQFSGGPVTFFGKFKGYDFLFRLTGDSLLDLKNPADYEGRPAFEGTYTELTMTISQPATVYIEPETLNLKSKGRFITCYIELPLNYDVTDIDDSTIKLIVNDVEISAESAPIAIGDFNDNNILDLMVKFERQSVQEACISTGVTTMLVLFETNQESYFYGEGLVRVIDQGKEHYSEDHGSVIY